MSENNNIDSNKLNSGIVDLTTDLTPSSTSKSCNKKGDENKCDSDCQIVEEFQLNDNGNRENEAGTSGTSGTVTTAIADDATTTVTNTNSGQVRRLRKRGRNYRINISSSSSSDEMDENVTISSSLNRLIADGDLDGYLSSSSSVSIILCNYKLYVYI